MKEIWKDIPNYNGYQVSNLGRVRTHNKTTYTKAHGIRHWKNRILKNKVSTNKYGRKDYRVELWSNGTHKTHLVARLVAFTFYELPLNSELTVNHIDGIPTNNQLDNLEIITRKENIKHGFKNNLYSKQIKIKIIDKKFGTILNFNNLADGCRYLKKSHSYLSDNIKRNNFENKNYMWQLI